MSTGHDPEYPLRTAGSTAGYYLQDGKEPPGQWAGKAAEALGLTGQVDPEVYWNLSGKLITPVGKKLYTGRPPRYVTGSGENDGAGDVAAAVAGLGPFTTPAEVRRARAKVLGSTGASVPFYDLTFSATKSVRCLTGHLVGLGKKSSADHIVKVRHRCDQVPATTLSYHNRRMPSARVERFVERRAG